MIHVEFKPLKINVNLKARNWKIFLQAGNTREESVNIKLGIWSN